jgi:hypothetical protein
MHKNQDSMYHSRAKYRSRFSRVTAGQSTNYMSRFPRVTAGQSAKYRALYCLFVCFESHEQFFSYLATVTITGDRAANFDLGLALAAFSSEGSFTCHTYFFKVISERPVILPYECRALDEGAITAYFKRLRFYAAGPSGARTHDLPFAKR